jgi:hypothetical protein
VKRVFCFVYEKWMRYAVDEPTDPLVVCMEILWGSNCKYCFAVRTFLAGLGTGLLFVGGVWAAVGVSLALLSWLLALGERHWLCDADTVPPTGQ